MAKDRISWPDFLMRAMTASGFRNAADLARASGVDHSVLTRWLREQSQPDLANLRKVSVVVDVPLLDLLVACGLLTPDEAGNDPQPAQADRPRTFDEALAWAEDLSPAEEEIQRALRRGMTSRDLKLRLARNLPRP